MLLAAGLMQWQIAMILGSSRETVKSQMTSLRAKAGGLTSVAIVADAVRHEIIYGTEIEKARMSYAKYLPDQALKHVLS